jgi:hypothetical protein
MSQGHNTADVNDRYVANMGVYLLKNLAHLVFTGTACESSAEQKTLLSRAG